MVRRRAVLPASWRANAGQPVLPLRSGEEGAHCDIECFGVLAMYTPSVAAIILHSNPYDDLLSALFATRIESEPHPLRSRSRDLESVLRIQSGPRATRCSPAHCVNATQICIVEVDGFTQLVLAPSKHQVLCNIAGSICEPHGRCVKPIKPK